MSQEVVDVMWRDTLASTPQTLTSSSFAQALVLREAFKYGHEWPDLPDHEFCT